MPNLETLTVTINAKATDATKAIDALAESLKRLNAALAPLSGLRDTAKNISAIASAARELSKVQIPANIAAQINAIKEAFKGFTIDPSLAEKISRLASAMRALSGISLNDSVITSLQNLIAALKGLKNIPSNTGSALSLIKKALDEFNQTRISAALIRKLGELADAISRMSTIPDISAAVATLASSLAALNQVRLSGTLARRIQELSAALATFSPTSGVASSLAQLAAAIAQLSGVGIRASLPERLAALKNALAGFHVPPGLAAALSELGAVTYGGELSKLITALNRLPKTIQALNRVDVNAFAQRLRALIPAIRELAQALAEFGPDAEAVSALLTSLSSVSRGGGGRGGSGGNGLMGGLMKLGTLRLAARYLGKVIDLSNKYQEDLNLFTAALGKYAKQAQDYAETVSEAFGIDPAAWLRNQGVFQTLITGFGVASDRAYIMSTNLTQLGYDLSSFFNITVEDAMTKIQSGISGELEPLRRLGYDLSKARLEAVAMSMGITEAFNDMTQAQKSQLRYEAILQQVTVAHGDMSRTLDAPANQLRILSAMATQAGRALGNVFIPMLIKILPIATAVVKAIRQIANAIASLFGFQLTDIDYSGLSGITGEAEEAEEALSGAGGGAEKLKKALMGFDEINQLPDFNESGGGGGGGNAIEDLWDWDLSSYDFLGNAINDKLDGIYSKIKPIVDWISEHIEGIAYTAGVLAGILLNLKIAGSFMGDASTLSKAFGGIVAAMETIATLGVDIVLQYRFSEQFLEEGNMSSFGNSIITTLVAGGLSTNFLAKSLRSIPKLQSKLGDKNIYMLAGGIVLGIDAAVQVYAQISKTLSRPNGDNWSWKDFLAAQRTALQSGLSAALIAAGAFKQGTKSAIGIGLVATGVLEIINVAPAVIKGDLGWETLASDAVGLLVATAGSFLTFGPTGALITLGVGAAIIIGTVIAGLINNAKSTADLDGWGTVTATAEECRQTAQALFDSIGVDAWINVISAQVKDREDATRKFDTALSDFQTTWLSTNDAGILIPITPGSEADFLKDWETTRASLDTRMQTDDYLLKVYTALGGFKDANGDIIDMPSFSAFDQAMYDVGEKWGKQIQDGIRQGADVSGLVEEMQWELSILTNAELGSATTASANTKLYEILASYDKKSFGATLKEYNALKSDTQSQFEADFDEQVLNMATDVAKLNNAITEAAAVISQMDPNSAEYATRMAFLDDLVRRRDEQQARLDSMDKDSTVADWMRNIFGETDYRFAMTFSMAKYETLMQQLDRGELIAAETSFKRVSSVDELRAVLPEIIRATYGFNNSERGLTTFLTQDTVDLFKGMLPADLADQLDTILSEMNISVVANNATRDEVAQILDDAATKFTQVKIPDTYTVNTNVTVSSEDGTLATTASSATYAGAFANGGFVSQGSLFIAGEKGPEIVGRIGNKSAVANEDQIADIVSSQMGGQLDEASLAAAIVGALKSAGMGAVYLDGRQLAASINSETRRTGKSAIVI